MDIIHLLMKFGLTHQEAQIYVCLHSAQPATGYELAKRTGISRSNSYTVLSQLLEKGGVYKIDGKPARYEALPISEFCQNVIRNLQQTQSVLEEQILPPEPPQSAYITIQGSRHIHNKIHTMLQQSQQRVYVSMALSALSPFLPALRDMVAQDKKVVLITDGAPLLPGAQVYIAPRSNSVLHLICDSQVALTGELDESAHCTCLFSPKKNLVNLVKSSIGNEIRWIELSEKKR